MSVGSGIGLLLGLVEDLVDGVGDPAGAGRVAEVVAEGGDLLAKAGRGVVLPVAHAAAGAEAAVFGGGGRLVVGAYRAVGRFSRCRRGLFAVEQLVGGGRVGAVEADDREVIPLAMGHTRGA